MTTANDLRQEAEILIHELGLSSNGDPVHELRNYVREEVGRLTDPFDDITTLNHLLRVVAGRLRVDLQFIISDGDISRLPSKSGEEIDLPAKHARKEFGGDGSTEGLLLHHPNSKPQGHDYLAIVDARGSKLYRAYFTAWHEIAHILITPHRLEDEKIRRTLPRENRTNPVERLVDDSASQIAFHEPIFRSALKRAYSRVGKLSFGLIEEAIGEALEEESGVPRPSLHATSQACLRLSDIPICFMRVDTSLKKRERERLNSPQMSFPEMEIPKPKPKLRVAEIYRNERASSTFEIASNMRVPPSSVIHRAYYGKESPSEESIEIEEQSEWETSTDGHLSPLPIAVSVAQRGPYTYALLSLAKDDARQ